MSVILGKVISLILTERFGPVVSSVGAFLFKRQSSPILYVRKGTDLPLSKVKEALCILIKHRLVTFKANKNENLANYSLDSEKVLYMLRYPKYLNLIKTQYGDEAEMIVEEILQRGYWSAPELILKVHERMSKNSDRPPTLVHIKDKLIFLITAKYLQRIPYSTDEKPVPDLHVDEKEMHVIPNIEIKNLVAHQADSSVALSYKNIYWAVNFDRFHQDMRDRIMVTAFTRKFDECSGEIIKLFLRQMYIRTEPWADVSNPIPAIEIKDILKRQQSNNSHTLPFFDQYINIIEQDNSKLLRKAGEASGGSYQIYLKEAFTQFVWELVEQVVLEKYDSKAARIFRLVKLKPYIEPDQIQQLAMIPAKDAKKLSYQLYEENFLHIQELRKTSANNGPTKNFTLFHIQLENVVRMLLEMCYKTLFNHISRRNHEKELNKRIIDKKQRVETILLGMRAQGATEEQINDIEEMITPPEKEILSNIDKIMKKLSTIELEIDDTIFLLKTFLLYY
ncbi:DNA-directed RNA polymerase III subunit RPC3 [Anthonomus grandis grandis]|uniref:DNA-directed RNA polymerase III subunit RPC3 n=1 Tax=Anthonomus grandis grandis TaxID=2921223 RepID=UPI0021660B76|nr:DNA-directed RNA polymerase III subunit RPC3 [Anthonomus grandis grandis]